MRLITLSLACALVATQAHALCLQPAPPARPNGMIFLKSPSEPFCLSGYKVTGTHDCTSYEISAYQNELKLFVRTLKEYHEEAIKFANQAIDYSNAVRDYADCEIRNLDR